MQTRPIRPYACASGDWTLTYDVVDLHGEIKETLTVRLSQLK